MKRIGLLVALSLLASVLPTSVAHAGVTGLQVVTSPPLAFSGTGWGGWSCPAGKVVVGGGFVASGGFAVSASAPGTPGSVWPHYTFGAGEYGWVVQNGGTAQIITVYAVCANAPAGYQVVNSVPLNYSDTGWGGWSCPAGKVVTGGGFEFSAGAVEASAPGTPGSVWPHYTFGAAEYGWVVRGAADGLSSPGSTVYAVCANAPGGYEVVSSVPLNYSDTGWGGWSCPAGKVVTGGGFQLPGSAAAASAPGTPGSSWPHYTFGAGEYGWVVQGAADGNSSPDSTVYAVCAAVGGKPGACCTGGGPGTPLDCLVTTQDDCQAQGGVFVGEGTSCGDDLEEQCIPLLVEMDSMSARAVSGGVEIHWSTAMEVDTIGFRVLRELPADGREKTLQVVASMIPSAGHGLTGAAYQILDDSKQAAVAVHYYIEDIDMYGRVTRHGPITVDRGSRKVPPAKPQR